MFTDIHQQTNLELLYRYLLHRLYDYDFKDKAQSDSKNSIFIPSGFDSKQLIESLCKNIAAFENKVFDEIIKRPSNIGNAQSKQKAEIATKDWHHILIKYHSLKG